MSKHEPLLDANNTTPLFKIQLTTPLPARSPNKALSQPPPHTLQAPALPLCTHHTSFPQPPANPNRTQEQMEPFCKQRFRSTQGFQLKPTFLHFTTHYHHTTATYPNYQIVNLHRYPPSQQSRLLPSAAITTHPRTLVAV
jgi:hypothetical protein